MNHGLFSSTKPQGPNPKVLLYLVKCIFKVHFQIVMYSSRVIKIQILNYALRFLQVTTTLMEEIVTFSEHLSEVEKQLTEISSVLKESGVTHFPNPVPY